MKKIAICRASFYVTGAAFLAVGLTLNTKTGLGTAPIISTFSAVTPGAVQTMAKEALSRGCPVSSMRRFFRRTFGAETVSTVPLFTQRVVLFPVTVHCFAMTNGPSNSPQGSKAVPPAGTLFKISSTVSAILFPPFTLFLILFIQYRIH